MLSQTEVRELLKLSNMELRVSIGEWERTIKNASKNNGDFAKRHVQELQNRIEQARAIIAQRFDADSPEYRPHKAGRY